MSKKIFKEALIAINVIKKNGLELSELCIHMETPDGEILELDIDTDEETGELIKSFNRFETESDTIIQIFYIFLFTFLFVSFNH